MRRRTKNVSAYIILLVVWGLYLYVRRENSSNSYNLSIDDSPLALTMFHPVEIEQLLLPSAKDEIVSTNENDYFTSLLSTVRRTYRFDQPKCRSNVNFALLMVYINTQFPVYFHHFISTVVRNPSIDVLIVASSDDCAELQGQYVNTNVHIRCVHREVLYFFIADGLCLEWKCKMFQFHRTFAMIKRKMLTDPTRLDDMKPMLGSLFRRYLSCYSHWAFGDFDVWLGNFDKLYPAALAHEYDIITFPYGDDERISMREQLTVLKNTRSIVSLWTQMQQFSSYTAFFEMIEKKKWPVKTITEGDFSTMIVDHRNVKWIQLPGFQLQDKFLGQSNTEVTVSTDRPPSLILRRVDQTDRGNSYTKLDNSQFLNLKDIKLLKGTSCRTLTWIAVGERRCIRLAKPLSQGYGTVVMRSSTKAQVSTGTILIGIKEYLLFNFRNGKKTFKWGEIALNHTFRVNITSTSEKTKS